MTERKLDLLARIDIFSELDESHLARIAQALWHFFNDKSGGNWR